MQKTSKKLILDACCGGRMMWFNKKHPNALYIDIRKTKKGIIPTHFNFAVKPDMVMDFRKMKFKDKTFKLVVWDPPHLTTLGKQSWVAKKYGILNLKTWRKDLKKGFNECWRVLDDNGILIFKWSEAESSKLRSITVNEVLEVFKKEPLFGHTTGRNGKTKWICFMKIV